MVYKTIALATAPQGLFKNFFLNNHFKLRGFILWEKILSALAALTAASITGLHCFLKKPEELLKFLEFP